MYQFTPMDISTKTAWDMKPEEVIKLLYEGKRIVIESAFIKKDDRRIPIELSIRMFDFKGKPTILSIARDITERNKVEKTQRRHEQRIRKLAAACIQAQEQEREVIAMEVHDRNLQTMLSIYHQIDKLESLVEPGSKEQQLAVSTLTLIKQAVAETRNIMKDLYPETLAQFGLVSLIEEELRRFQMEMHCLGTLDIRCSKRLPKDIETTLYRVFHEALLNVKRHAGEFKKVVIRLHRSNDYIKMQVEDDGSGFDIKTDGRRAVPGGIESMRRRTEIVGGIFKASSVSGRGTKITVRVPLVSKVKDKQGSNHQ
jgi:signal transduction histidine kinase